MNKKVNDKIMIYNFGSPTGATPLKYSRGIIQQKPINKDSNDKKLLGVLTLIIVSLIIGIK